MLGNGMKSKIGLGIIAIFIIACIVVIAVLFNSNKTELNKFITAKDIKTNVEESQTADVQIITLDLNGGSGYPINIYVKDGIPYGQLNCAESSKMTKFVIPTKSGYKFMGYYDGKDEYVSSDGTLNLTLIKNHYLATQGDYTITAKWEKIQIITLDLNGGSDVEPIKLYVFEGIAYSDLNCTTKISKITTPTRNEYEFEKFTNSNGSEIIDHNGIINSDAIKEIWTGTKEDYTATAQWEGLQNLYIRSNGGSGGTSHIYIGILNVYSDSYGKNAITSVTLPRKAGYTAIGDKLFINSDGDLFIFKLIECRKEMGVCDISTTIRWEVNTYTVKYNYNGATGGNSETSKEITYDSVYGELPTPTRTYTISFDSNKGSECANQIATWNFDGWYDGAKENVTENTIVKATGNHEISASWSGGTINLPTPIREGYAFKEWNTEKEGTGISISDSTQFTEDMKLYAQWNEQFISVKNIVVDKTDITLKAGTTEKITATVTPENASNKKVIWESNNEKVATVDENGIVTAKEKGTAIITVTTEDGKKIAKATVTVEENAVTKVQTITLNKNGGEGGTTYIYVSEDDNGNVTTYSDPNCLNKITKIDVPTKEGYIFEGYMFNEGETQIHILSDGTLNNIVGHYHASTSNYELKAIWEKESTDTTKPTIISILGEKDSDGNYKVVIKAKDESGIKKVTINGNEITKKDSNGNYYFVPIDNGTYTIEVYNTKDNKTEYTYTEINILKKMKMTAEKDSNGNNIVYIETATNKGIKEVKVNENEITQRDETGRYVFKTITNGKYAVNVTYDDGTIESKEYEETRFTDSGSEDNSNESNNNGNSNSGSNSNESSNNKSSSSENGTTSGQNGTSGNTISTSTALTTLPKTGTKLGALYAIIASGISTVFAWFKSKKIK